MLWKRGGGEDTDSKRLQKRESKIYLNVYLILLSNKFESLVISFVFSNAK